MRLVSEGEQKNNASNMEMGLFQGGQFFSSNNADHCPVDMKYCFLAGKC
jgi:hypothetical protein